MKRHRTRGPGIDRRLFGLGIGIGLGLGTFAVNPALGQCELARLLPSDGAVYDASSVAVAIGGSPGNEVAIIGADAAEDYGELSGSAYIFRFDGTSWVKEAKLLATDGAIYDRFGGSVAIGGSSGREVAIVGAFWDDDQGLLSGSAYIFRFDGASWVEEAKLLASDGATYDNFGCSVSIGGSPGHEVAIVGAYGDSDFGSRSGSAYVFRFDGGSWVQEAKLLASDGATGDWFGFSVSLGGSPGHEVAIVGARQDDDLGSSSGSAYIYRFDGASWLEEAKLLPSDDEGGGWFGSAVSLCGPTGNEVAIVGAPLDDDQGTRAGSAYIYRFDGTSWVDEAKLLASDGARSDRFGQAVSIGGSLGNEVAIIGADGRNDTGPSSGSAYIYRFDGASWVENTKIMPSNGSGYEYFGHAASFGGPSGNEVAIVGGSRENDNGTDSGLAYVIRGLGDCNDNGVLDCQDVADGTSPDANGNGIPDECDPPPCPADLNGDGVVDAFDVVRVAHALRTRGDVPEDLDGDGVVTPRDLHIVIRNFGPCP